jgi:hypothetical protein
MCEKIVRKVGLKERTQKTGTEIRELEREYEMIRQTTSKHSKSTTVQSYFRNASKPP